MANYDFNNSLSPLDFELLSKDLLESELGVRLENFREGRDKGIDLRYAPHRGQDLIVQCKRYATYASLKSELANKELPKVAKLKPSRYILTTSVPLSPQQADELKSVLSPHILSTDDIFGRDRLNSLLEKHPEVERRHIKLWVGSAGVLDSILNARTHTISREEVERTIASAKIYVRNPSFDEALKILKEHHVCIISGLPGIGKTTLARMLLLYFYERKHDIVKIESDISEARDAAYHNHPRFYYYDDFLGQTAQADKLNKNEDQKLLDFMCSIRASKDSVMVLTTREYILNQAKLHYEKLDRENFDHRICIIDLSKYSRRIRAQILYNHLHFSDLPRQHLESLVSQRGYVQIVDHANYNPRLIEYLTSTTWVGKTPSSEYLPLFISNLDNPVKIWEHAFRNQLSHRARHLLFVLTTLPGEMILADLETAFSAFHGQQCDRFKIPHGAGDFRSALKELDGTFVATRKIRDKVLARFQNPSIRDFMQNLLLSGELLTEIFKSLVFYEQAEWFWETLNDPNPQIPLTELARYRRTIANLLMQLSEAKSCSFHISTFQNSPWVSLAHENPALRFAQVASAITSLNDSSDSSWIAARTMKLAERLEARNLSVSSCVSATTTLRAIGCLESAEGKRFIAALKSNALDAPADLDDFHTLGKLVQILPHGTFAKSELKNVREAYDTFADHYPDKCGITDPDELREDASRMETIDGLLGMDTQGAQDSLKDAADEIEEEQAQEGDHDPDDESRGGGGFGEECSDSELDSMFGTL